MLDLQTVTFAESVTASVKSVVPTPSLRIADRDKPLSVAVNGIPQKFFKEDTYLYVSLVGVSYVNVRTVLLQYDAGSVMYGPREIAPFANSAAQGFPVTSYLRTVLLVGDPKDVAGFSDVVAVHINGSGVSFVPLSTQVLLVKLPEVGRVTQLDVLRSQQTVVRDAVFLHQLGDSISTTTGEQKLLSQFLKCLISTSGTDQFDKEAPAGNLQTWTTEVVEPSNFHALAAKVTIDITKCSMMFSLRQMMLNIPDNEKLAFVEVTNIGLSQNDPGTVELSLRIVSRAGIAQQFSTLLNTAQTTVADAVAAQGR